MDTLSSPPLRLALTHGLCLPKIHALVRKKAVEPYQKENYGNMARNSVRDVIKLFVGSGRKVGYFPKRNDSCDSPPLPEILIFKI